MLTQWAKNLLMGRYSGSTGIETNCTDGTKFNYSYKIRDVNGDYFFPALTAKWSGVVAYGDITSIELQNILQANNDIWGRKNYNFYKDNINQYDINYIRENSSSYYNKRFNFCTPLKFVFGSNNLIATAYDYKIWNPITEGITINSISASQTIEEDKIKTFYIINGFSENNIEINEIGIVKPIYEYKTSPSSPSFLLLEGFHNVLIAREALSEPLNLMSNESFTIVFEIDI